MSEEPGFFLATVSNKTNGLASTDLEGLFYGDGTADSPESPKERMIRWQVQDSADEMDTFSFELENGDMSLIDSELFAKGNTIEFQFGRRGRMAGPFKGIINQRRGWRQLQISGTLDGETKIALGQATEKFVEKSLSQIAEVLFKRVGLKAEVDDTEIVLPVVIKRDETILQFLKRKSKEAGSAYVVYVEGDTGFWKSKTKEFQKAPNRTLRWATEEEDSHYETIGEPEFVDEQQNTAVEENVRGFNMKDKKAIDEKANNETSTQTSLGKGTYYFDESVGGLKFKPKAAKRTAETGRTKTTQKQTKEEAEAVATSTFDDKNSKAFQLNWTIMGDESVAAKNVILVECPSDQVSGRWYANSVIHTGEQGYYTTQLEMIRNALGKAVGTKPPTPEGGSNEKEAEAGDTQKYRFDEPTGRIVPKGR